MAGLKRFDATYHILCEKTKGLVKIHESHTSSVFWIACSSTTTCSPKPDDDSIDTCYICSQINALISHLQSSFYKVTGNLSRVRLNILEVCRLICNGVRL